VDDTEGEGGGGVGHQQRRGDADHEPELPSAEIVERTGAWFNRFRRLRVRDERRADIHAAFVALATALILLNYLARF
jgi:hypothetical protein